MGDLRHADRTEYRGKINLSWSDDTGNPCARNAECLNISCNGLKVKTEFQLPLRSVVSVRASELALHGSASVRSCVRQGVKYIVGLEFLGGLKWKHPTAADNPIETFDSVDQKK